MRALATLLALTLAGVLAACGGEDSKDEDEKADAPAETTEAPAAPSGPSLWVAVENGNVYRVDPESGEVVATVKAGSYPSEVAVGDEAVWVANAQSGDVTRIDPETNKATATLDTEDARSVAIGDGQVWVARITTDPPSVVPIDPKSNELGEPIETGEELQPESLVYDDGILYAEESYGGGVLRIDTEGGGRVKHLDLDQVVTDLDLHDGAIYVAGLESVIQVDPATLKVTEEYPNDDRPWSLAPDPETNAIYAAMQAPTVRKLDLASGKFSAAKGDLGDAGGQPYDAAIAEGSLWVVDEGGKLHQVDLQSLSVTKTIALPGASGAASMTLG